VFEFSNPTVIISPLVGDRVSVNDEISLWCILALRYYNEGMKISAIIRKTKIVNRATVYKFEVKRGGNLMVSKNGNTEKE